MVIYQGSFAGYAYISEIDTNSSRNLPGLYVRAEQSGSVAIIHINTKEYRMYPPLVLSEQMNIENIPDSNKTKRYMLDMQNGNDELLRILGTSNTFGTGHYDGPYKEFSDYIHQQWRNIYKWASGYEPEKDVFNKANRALVLDSFVGMVMISKWNEHKKVYRFDPELELALATVDEVKVPLKMLDRLPFRSFYLEFAPDGVFTPAFHGCFVEVMRFTDGVTLKFLRLNDKLQTMSGVGDFSVDRTEEDPCVVIKREHVDGHHESDPNGLRTDWEEFCFFALNAIIYLCANNADIRESEPHIGMPFSKKTQKLLQTLNVSECGYVYGKTIRLNRIENEISEKVERKPSATRKTPRPHPVRASWQHYWKGSGENKERVLLFKDPYFTGAKINCATISKVTGNL